MRRRRSVCVTFLHESYNPRTEFHRMGFTHVYLPMLLEHSESQICQLGNPESGQREHALMDGRAYTNKELASVAGISPQTATAHLRILGEAGLITATKSGRCVYHRIATAEVAEMLERMAAVAPMNDLYLAQRRKAGDLAVLRSCYDHLAGPLAVRLTQSFLERTMLVEENGGYTVIRSETWVQLGVTLREKTSVRPFVRPCLDWTERKPHVAGPLGRQLFDHGLSVGWYSRQSSKRGLVVNDAGRQALQQILGLDPNNLEIGVEHA